MTLLAWHSDPGLKAAAVARMRAHREADRFIQGLFLTPDGASFRGCFHGCLTAEAVAAERGVAVAALRDGSCSVSSWWAETERLFGIPKALCMVLDDAFEQDPCDVEAAANFAVDVTEAIPVGADLSAVAGLAHDEALDDDSGWDHARIIELLRAAPVPQPAEG